MTSEIRDEQSYAVIGAAMAVHGLLGHGFLEAVYTEALGIELAHQAIPFRREVSLPISYRGRELRTSYRADFICFDSLLVEVKALPRLTGLEHGQIINHLKASGFRRGLLINFGSQSLDWKRVVFS